MEIQWYGYGSAQIKGKDATILLDAYMHTGQEKYPQASSVQLFGDGRLDANGVKRFVDAEAKQIDWPGEFEASGIAMEARAEKMETGEFVIFKILIDEFHIVHLSGICQELSDEMIDFIGTVDVLLMPIGGNSVLDPKKAQELMERIEPRLMVPLYADFDGSTESWASVDNFLRAMGRTEEEEQEKLVLKSRSALSDDQTKVVKLKKV